VVLRMILDSPDRPIYFAKTAGMYGESLGFGPWLLTQGLARKLVHQMPNPGRDTVLVAGEGFVDVLRSRDLWLKDSLGPRAIAKKNGWPDKASLNVPVTYIMTGVLLSDVLTSAGQDSAAATVLAQAQTIARATRLSQLFDFSTRPPPPPSPDADVRSKEIPTVQPESTRKR